MILPANFNKNTWSLNPEPSHTSSELKTGLYYNYMKNVKFFMSFLYLNKILSEICSKLFKDHLVHIVLARSNLITRFMQDFRMLRCMRFLFFTMSAWRKTSGWIWPCLWPWIQKTIHVYRIMSALNHQLIKYINV